MLDFSELSLKSKFEASEKLTVKWTDGSTDDMRSNQLSRCKHKSLDKVYANINVNEEARHSKFNSQLVNWLQLANDISVSQLLRSYWEQLQDYITMR